jgi:hypothetical protein
VDCGSPGACSGNVTCPSSCNKCGPNDGCDNC